MMIALLAVAPLSLVGCQKTFRGAVAQPNPLSDPKETLRVSEKVTIVTGDMELRMPSQGARAGGAGGRAWVDRRYPLRNIASFTVVSRDRLRVHVQVEHKWKEWADLHSWKAYLVDDQGRRYKPEELNGGYPRHLATMWDYETRSVVRNHFREVVAIRDDAHRRRKPLASLSVFRGSGSFVFYSRDIFTPDVKKLTLVLERASMAFKWTWKFAEDGGPPGDEHEEIYYIDEEPLQPIGGQATNHIE